MKTNLKTGPVRFFAVLIVIMTISFPAKSQIAKDKQMHIGAGAVVAGWGYMIPGQSTGWKPFVYGVGSATVAGMGKELADLGGFGTPDLKDLGATVIGGLVSVGIITGVKAIFRKPNSSRRRAYFAMKTN